MTLDIYADLFDDALDAVAVALDVEGEKNVAKMWATAQIPLRLDAPAGANFGVVIDL